jgi:hypothetical protein
VYLESHQEDPSLQCKTELLSYKFTLNPQAGFPTRKVFTLMKEEIKVLKLHMNMDRVRVRMF